MTTTYASPYDALRGDTQGEVAVAYGRTNTNQEAGTWATPDQSVITPANMFGGTAAGACAYFGGDKAFLGMSMEYTQEPGFDTNTMMHFEYWNGASWASTQMMMVEKDDPEAHHSMGGPGGEGGPLTGRFSVRLGQTPNWASKTLDGQAAFWVRMRISGDALTQNAQVRWKTLELIYKGKPGEYYGTECPRRPLVAQPCIINGAGGAAATIDIGGDYTVNIPNATFANGSDTSLLYRMPVPEGVNSAFPIEIDAVIIPATNAGNVKVECTGHLLYPGMAHTSAAEVAATPVILNTTGNQDKLMKAHFALNVPGIHPGSYLMVRIRRNANDAADTAAGNVTMWDFKSLARFYK